MANKNKAQGTAEETGRVNKAKAWGLRSWRLPEGGQRDAGDLVIVDAQGDHWVVESKARANLNPHLALAKAKEKVAQADLPFVPFGTVVVHKRLVDRGGKRRVPTGLRRVVVMDEDDFLTLLGGTDDHRS